MSTDQTITDEIRERLARNPRIHHPAEIAVSERAGAVILRGTVRSPRERHTAATVARSVHGVRVVDDELRVDPRDHSRDGELRGIALQALMSDDRVPAHRIDVDVASGWLTLTGAVKHQGESDAAFEVVAGIAGVGGVTNRIEVVTAGLDG
jgi:osmotically-inducible protein OsmY